jgi:hypothetical protein
MAHLRFPASVVAGELMNEQHGGALARFFVIQALTIVGLDVWHVRIPVSVGPWMA